MSRTFTCDNCGQPCGLVKDCDICISSAESWYSRKVMRSPKTVVTDSAWSLKTVEQMKLRGDE